MASACCKYKDGVEIKTHTARAWILSSTYPADNAFKDHLVSQPVKYKDKSIGDIYDDLTNKSPRPKTELCNLYATIEEALNDLPIYKNNSVASKYLRDLDTLCEKPICDELSGEEKLKCKCKRKKTWDDTEYENAKKACEGKKPVWDPKKCKCVKKEEEIVIDDNDDEGDVGPDDAVKGCMLDKPYVTNYNPEATVNAGCIFIKVIKLENEFCFCTRDTCDQTKQCLKGEQEITGQTIKNTKQAFDDKYQRIYNRALEVILELNPRVRISGEKGFYAENIDSRYVNDLANALAILHFRGYSLIRAEKGEQEDQSDLVMRNLEGDYLGFFRGTNYTEPLFNNLNFNLTAPVVRKRVNTNDGGTIDSAWINTFKDVVNKPGVHYKEDVIITDDGIIILPESKTPVGLGSLLVKKVEGLGQLLQ